MSEFTGLSVTFISDLERGKLTAKIEKTIRLINVLGMDLMVEISVERSAGVRKQQLR